MLTSLQLLSLGLSDEQYNSLSSVEKEAVEQILSEMSEDTKSGTLTSLEQLYYADYDEIPVDFITFLTDDNYLGKATKNGKSIFPFWQKEGTYIFSRSDITEVAISGSIGTGKSTFACLLVAYHLYRTMCLRDPQGFFGLAQGTEITYAFLNNTLDSSYGVGYKTLQAFIKDSPWFLKHGKLVGREQDEYLPEKGFSFVVGSKVQHTIGRAIVCLSGDMEVLTEEGFRRIDSLEEKPIKVISYDYDHGKILSNKCTVKETAQVSALLEIELEDGSIVRCTPEHRWMLKDGTYKMAKDLSEEDELMDIN